MSKIAPYLVGIVGGSGSGKTTFIKELFKQMPKSSVAIVSQDNYYHPIEQQPVDKNGQENFDTPGSIDRERFHRDINTLIGGGIIQKEEYTFNNEIVNSGLIEVESAPIIITEGLFVFHYTEIFSLLDYKVFIDAEEDIRLQRRIIRDFEERAYGEEAVRYQWENHVMPADKKYLQPFKPDSDIIVDNNSNFQNDLDSLIIHLKGKI